MEQVNKKHFSYPILLLFVLIVGLCLIFTFSYAFQEPLTKTPGSVSILEISMTDYGKGIKIEDSLPLSDEEGKKIEAYQFLVRNRSDRDLSYQILIEDLPLGEIDDGCTSDTLLTRNQLKYELRTSKTVVGMAELNQVKLNQLARLTLGANQEETFEFRLWVPESAKDTAWQKKHYHYKIVVESLES